MTFVSDREGPQHDVWTKRADGSGTAELVLDTERLIREGSYSPDETWLVFREGPGASGDICAIRPAMDSVPAPLVATEFGERSPTLSPNGRWLAYVSAESGRQEVYMRPFPDVDSGRWLISTDGGVEPVWAHSGRELFYRNASNELVAVQVVTGGQTFSSGQQVVLFSMSDYLDSDGHPMYDVSPDDQRFVMFQFEDADSVDELILVDNWAEELRERPGN